MPDEYRARQRPPDQEGTILAALSALELKLTEIIRTGIDSITREHNQTILEQAKLNASFANRDSLETLARRVDTISQDLLSLHRQDDLSTIERKENREALTAFEDLINKRNAGVLSGTLGYIITAAIVFAGAIVTFVLNHVIH